MACSSFHLLVILLGISHLLTLNDAIPVTRIEKLRHENEIKPHQVVENAQPASIEKNLEGEVAVIDHARTLAVELNDYPGSGANNRHTPRAQFGRCFDC